MAKMQYTDAKVKLTSEVLTGMLVNMYVMVRLRRTDATVQLTSNFLTGAVGKYACDSQNALDR